MYAYRAGDKIHPDAVKANGWEDYVASAVLTDLLADGTASRLYQRLVKRDQLATHVGAMLGTFGDPFDMRDPTMLQLLAYLPPGDLDPLLASLNDEVETVRAGGATEEEVDRVVTTMTAQTIRRLDDIMNRALAAAALEQQRSRAELLSELPTVLAAVTPDDITRVAGQWLQPTSRAVLEVVPGGER